MDELEFDGKKYLSSKRAAEVTGYAKDYVGQLCREGRIQARLVGRAWYVDEESIKEHRFGEKETKDISEQVVPTEKFQSTSTSQKEEVANTWGTSVYASETVEIVPTLRERVDVDTLGNLKNIKPVRSHSSVHSMQSVWQEWFNNAPITDQRAEILESADPIVDSREDFEEVEPKEVEVSIHRVAPKQDVFISKSATQQVVPKRQRRVTQPTAGSNNVLRSLFIAGALLFASLAFFSLGFGSELGVFRDSFLADYLLGVTK